MSPFPHDIPGVDRYKSTLLGDDLEYAGSFPIASVVLIDKNPEYRRAALAELERQVDRDGDLITTAEGLSIRRWPYVYNAKYAGSANVMAGGLNRLLGKVHEVHRSGLTMIEVGSGTGRLGIMAAKKGIGQVVALDRNPIAAAATQYHAKLNNVESRHKTYKSNLFEAIEGQGILADIIIGGLPFDESEPFADVEKPVEVLQGAYFDHELKLNYKLLNNARKFLRPGGILLQNFSDMADVEKFRQNAANLGWRFLPEYDSPTHYEGHNFFAWVMTPVVCGEDEADHQQGQLDLSLTDPSSCATQGDIVRGEGGAGVQLINLLRSGGCFNESRVA